MAIIGIMAAVAIPNFVKFQERARAAAAAQQQQLQKPVEPQGSPSASER